MYLHVAVKRALETGERFYRPSDGAVSVHLSVSGMRRTVSVHLLRDGSECDYWNPTGDDFITDDWEMCPIEE